MDLDAGPEVFPPAEHAFFRSPEDVYGTALMFLAERFHHLLVEEDDFGMIVVDSRFREEDAACGASSATWPRRGRRT